MVIIVGGEPVAEFPRARGKYQSIVNPLHYVELTSRKHRSATRALAFADERLPRPLIVLRDRLIERDGARATKTWTAVLRLALESSLAALSEATEIALVRGTLDPQAIALILRQRESTGAHTLDLARYHNAPATHAQAITLDAYRIADLLEGAP